ncbi:nucleotidyltransferase domain-containing protein [Sulfurimonas sp. NW15]|uniref:nucleotidyltransferase domain-containing protein n=1 Tax=Sulfurimonas sp. NW15 TaxID=2922729 RepID=UPI003DA7F0E0
MRLNEKEISIIKDTIFNEFGNAQVYLFGSRLDDSKRGGDIDLFIISNEHNLLEKKLKTLAKLKRVLHKPVDIVLHKNFDRIIEQEALRGIGI